MTKAGVLTIVLAVAAVVVCSSGAATTPFGATYKTVVQGQVPALNGTWRIAFTGAGGYTVTKQAVAGKLIVGKATVKGNTMTFHDASGPLACKGGTAGRYVWTASGKKLTLKILKD